MAASGKHSSDGRTTVPGSLSGALPSTAAAALSSLSALPAVPCYAVIFTSHRTDADDAYGKTAERMVELASRLPGYLGIDSARGSDGVGITVSYWKDEESILHWKGEAEHLDAQARGRSVWYRDYSLRVARVERAYTMASSSFVDPGDRGVSPGEPCPRECAEPDLPLSERRHASIRALTPDDVAECEALLRALPDWFGIEEAIVQYVRELTVYPSYVFVHDPTGGAEPQIVGVVTERQHGRHTSEIHLVAVHPAFHGRGVGSSLIAHIEEHAIARGSEFLQVKTLGPSRVNSHYERTRAFYEGRGFRWLEETNLWGPTNPCLILVKSLRSRSAS